MSKIDMVHDILKDNGKSIKENNLSTPHNIPIGALVEARWDEWFGGGACWKVHARLWVVGHSHYLDGTAEITHGWGSLEWGDNDEE